MGKVMNEFPKTFQDWVTRHISDFNGCNRYLSRWKEGATNFCPSCKQPNEDTKHILRCTDKHRTTLYQQDVKTVLTWLRENHTPSDLYYAIRSYLQGRGSVPMSECVAPYPRLHQLGSTQDAIGFDNFLIGRLPSLLGDLMSTSLQRTKLRRATPDLWLRRLSHELILLTHKQWTYRNFTVHYKPSGNKTAAEHDIIDQNVLSLMELDPNQLPIHRRNLLTATNFTKLGSSSVASKLYWIAEVQSALDEAAITAGLSRTKHSKNCINSRRNNTTTATPNINSPLFPHTKGSNAHHTQSRQRA
jgi:hypothetical protein